MDNLKTVALASGVNLRLLKSEKFKTNLISVYFCLPLKEETATMAALLPRVLKRGTEQFPEMSAISKRAQELYGAALSVGIMKKGDLQLIRFSVESVADKFLSEGITDGVLELISQTVLFPKTENGVFDAGFVEQEKENAKNFIEGLINDKKEYAAVRLNEIMFEGDPYGIFEYGSIKWLEETNEKNLFEFYKNLLNTARVEIFVGGNFSDEEIVAKIQKAFAPLASDREALGEQTAVAKIEENIEVKRVTEEMKVSQSKLCMGFNCGVDVKSKEYYALALFSCIFGGSPFSKLFNNVREKLSLAYYVFSAVERQKGCLKISAGIESSKLSAAYDEIFVQLEKMKNGDFTDEEILSAKKYMSTSLNSVNDSLAAAENFFLGQLMLGKNDSPKEFLENIEKVEKSEIMAAANAVQLDTVYFLKGVGANEV